MTRYRLKTLRRIEAALARDEGMSVRELSEELNRAPRVIRNYLRMYPDRFEIQYKRAFQETIWGLKSR